MQLTVCVYLHALRIVSRDKILCLIFNDYHYYMALVFNISIYIMFSLFWFLVSVNSFFNFLFFNLVSINQIELLMITACPSLI